MTQENDNTFTAACCVIGDEILNGKTQDSNSHYLAKFLFERGIELKRVEVIPDDMEAISECVRKLSATYDVVFTSGGIGITHDDLSYAAIAKAYDLEMKLDHDTFQRVQKMLEKRKVTDIRGYDRLAIFPHPAQLLRPNPNFMVPIVIVNRNIYILPGVPRLFQMLLDSLGPHLEDLMKAKTGKAIAFHRAEVATRQTEGQIAAFLSSIQDKVQAQNIKIGSYPLSGNGGDIRVIVSVTGKDYAGVKAVARQIAKQIDGWEPVVAATSSSSSSSSSSKKISRL